jgi:hypothetical protein
MSAMMQTQFKTLSNEVSTLSSDLATSQKSLLADLDAKFATYSARVDARVAEVHVRIGEVDDRIAKVELENGFILRQVGDLQTSLVDIRQNIMTNIRDEILQSFKDECALELKLGFKKECLEQLSKTPAPCPVPAPSVTASSKPEVWVPSRIFVRGWCAYGQENSQGISSEEGEGAGSKIKALLPVLVQNEIERILCPYFKNRQITFMLKKDIDRERAWVVFEALKAMVLAKSPVVRGQPVFVAMDQPPWKRERNSLIAKAARIFIETAAVSKDCIVLDWTSGSL